MKSSQADKFEISISKEELNALPIEKYTGEIILVEDEESADAMLEVLNVTPVTGFDTETKPAFKKGQINSVALMQLATETKCYLVRLNKIGITEGIKRFLEDPSKVKVGLSIKDDFNNLSKITKLSPGGFIDIQDYVKEFKITDASLTKVHAIIFGRRISKSQQLSNWEAPALTPKQQEYAALDAKACINIYNQLKNGGFDWRASNYKKEKWEENE